MAFFFSREGPVEEFGAAEELAEAPEAIEMPVVLWHVVRCTGAEDLVGASEDFLEELRTLKEQNEELAVRALKMLALRALLRSLAVRALKKKEHWAYVRAS